MSRVQMPAPPVHTEHGACRAGDQDCFEAAARHHVRDGMSAESHGHLEQAADDFEKAGSDNEWAGNFGWAAGDFARAERLALDKGNYWEALEDRMHVEIDKRLNIDDFARGRRDGE